MNTGEKEGVNTESVIVLNGSYHNTLTIVQSLAKKGIPVIVGDKARGIKSYFGEAMLSRYPHHRFLYPFPESSPLAFIDTINRISEKYNALILLPVGADTYVAVSAFREYLHSHIRTVLADDSLIQKAHDKYTCLKFAEEIGVRIPQTRLLREISSADDIMEMGLPLVIKPRKGAGSLGVKIVDNVNDVMGLRKNLAQKFIKNDYQTFKIYDDSDPLVQEFIEGPIVDACVIADHGEIKAMVTQERLKTLPPQGGYGVMNKTVMLPEVKEMAERLITGLGWHGLAQVEFKYNPRDATYRLMEVNPKFWGTLAISVAAGVDFPYMAYQMAKGDNVKPVIGFKENCVYRWVLPNELLHVVQSDNRKEAFKQYIKDFFKPAHYNIDLRDPLPIVSLFLKFLDKRIV